MNIVHFESGNHKGTIRAQTAFERSLRSAVIRQHGRTIAEAKGFDWEADNSIPPILDILLVRYFDWMMYTTFESGGIEPVNFLTVNGNLVSHFDSFVHLVSNNVDLASAWQAAFEQVNKVPTTEADEKKGANTPETSETS